MFWHKITTGSGRAALIAVMILCGAAALLSSGVWIRVGGHEIDMWKCVRSIGNVSAEAWLTQYSAGVRSFLGTVCLLQWGCAVLHILAIYELWKKGESVLIYGAIPAVIILFVILWFCSTDCIGAESSTAAGTYFGCIRLNVRAWAALGTVCAADIVYSVWERMKTKG